MSSIEIAELTGKRHADVMRDIRNLLDQGVHQRNFALMFRVNDLANGAQRKDPYYELTKKGCLILASGYNALLREKIIDRWEELELLNAQQSPEEIMAMWVRVKFMLKSALHFDYMIQNPQICNANKFTRVANSCGLRWSSFFLPKHRSKQ